MRRPLILLAPMLLLCGCAALRPTPTPIGTLDLTPSDNGRCLIVLLPGLYSSPETFDNVGFAEIAEELGLDADLVAVNAHLGYYRKRTVIERIRNDVVLPAKEQGYQDVWLAGASLGGLGAILYMREHPGELSGVFAIAPFLGEEDVIDEIELAGGPDKWTPPQNIEKDDVGRQLWAWIREGGVRESETPIFLGWGTLDEFDRSNRMLSGYLPSGRIYTVEGGHDWKTWDALWRVFIERASPCQDLRAMPDTSH